jgi:hypothetical protein
MKLLNVILLFCEPKKISAFLMILFTYSHLLYANEIQDHEFIYHGQEEENFELVNQVFQTEYRDEDVEDTCYQDVPYTAQECHYEDYWDKDCQWVPGETRCWDEPYQVCEDVPFNSCQTKYREECKRIPLTRCRDVVKRQCHRVPKEQCRDVTHIEKQCIKDNLGNERCKDVKVTKNECRTTYEEECENVTVKECDTEYDQVCHNIPYEECRTEYRRDCSTHYRRECKTDDSTYVCEDVLKNHQVCVDVTKYTSQPYLCTKTISVAHEVLKQKHIHSVKYIFNPDIWLDFSELLSIKTTIPMAYPKSIFKDATFIGDNLPFFILAEYQVTEKTEGVVTSIRHEFNTFLVETPNYLKTLKHPLEDVTLSREKISFRVGEIIHPESFLVELNFMEVDSKKKASELQSIFKSIKPEHFQIENVLLGPLEGELESIVTIDFSKVQLAIPSDKTFSVELDFYLFFYNLSFLNSESFGPLKLEKKNIELKKLFK